MSSFIRKSFRGATGPEVDFLVLDETIVDERIGLRHPIPLMFDQPEPPMVKYWGHIEPGDVVIDVGACYGQWTLPALALGASVIAFEPFERGRTVLEAEIAANEWEGRSVVVSQALTSGLSYPGRVALPYPAPLFDEVWTKHYPTDKYEIGFITLDAFFSLYAMKGCPGVDFIKCDNEGGELPFVQGAMKTLERYKPFLIVENHEGVDMSNAVSRWPKEVESTRQMTDLLTDLGYELEIMPWDCGRRFDVWSHPDMVGSRPGASRSWLSARSGK